MEIETGGIKRPIIGVTVGGFKVTSGLKVRRIPETATEVGDEGDLGPQLGDFADKD